MVWLLTGCNQNMAVEVCDTKSAQPSTANFCDGSTMTMVDLDWLKFGQVAGQVAVNPTRL
jgi:hypothetical protein